MSKKLISTLFTAIILSTLVFVISVRAAAGQSDVDGDGIPDAVAPATIIHTNVTLSAGAYTFKNLIVMDTSVLTLSSGTSPDGFKRVCIAADTIIVEEGSSLYIDGMGYFTGQDLAAGVISTDIADGRQVVKLSVGSDYSGQSVTDYPEQIGGVPEGGLAVAPEDLSSCELYILMDDDAEFIKRLISFGLSEKEAQLYYHLLKYGPKPLSLLAKSLKTYREDIYRTLNRLIDKGMVRPSLETSTVYAAVELDIALGAVLKKHETEPREMEMKKQELQELSQQQLFRPSGEFSTFKIIKSVKDAQAFGMSVIPSLEEEILWTGPELSTTLFSMYGTGEASVKVIERGGCVRGITDISYRAIETVQQHMDWGHDIRHIDKYSGIIMAVFNRKHALTGINIDFERITRCFSLDELCTFLLTDDPTYIEYLVSTFELLWKQAIPAAQRIEELSKEGVHRPDG